MGPVFRNGPGALAGVTPKTRKPVFALAVRVLKHPRAPIARVLEGPPRFVGCHLLKVRVGEFGRSVPMQVAPDSIASMPVGHRRMVSPPRAEARSPGPVFRIDP